MSDVILFALFGCLYSSVALDIRGFPGPNTRILAVWRVTTFGPGIGARYRGAGRTAKKKGPQCRGVRLEIGLVFVTRTPSLVSPPARTKKHRGGTLATVAATQVRPSPALPPSVATYARRRQPPPHLLIPAVRPQVAPPLVLRSRRRRSSSGRVAPPPRPQFAPPPRPQVAPPPVILWSRRRRVELVSASRFGD